MLTGVLQEIFGILYGIAEYLPEKTISIVVGIGLFLLILYKRQFGIALVFIIFSILVGMSFFSQGDIYQLTLERTIAGIVLGVVILSVLLVFPFKPFLD